MWLIKNHKSGKYYKTKYRIDNDKLCHLHSFPFVKAGVLTEVESRSSRLCTDKWSQIEQVTKFDGRVHNWMRDCEWFTWLVVIDDKN